MRRAVGTTALVLCACTLAAGCRGVSVRKVRRGTSVAGVRRPAAVDFSPAPSRAGESYRAGLASEKASSEIASQYYLEAVVGAAGGLSGPGGQADESRALYGAALEKFLRVTGGRRPRLNAAWRDGLAARGIRISVLRDGKVWTPDRFDEFLFADDFEVRGLEPQNRTEGLGVPMIAVKRFRLGQLDEGQSPDKYLMPRQVYPVTAVLRVIPPHADTRFAGTEFRLELYDSTRARRVEISGQSEPLAIDLTTPLAYLFARSPLPLLQDVGLLDPQWLEKLAGLYMLHPYEPGKIPVVLVHGLRSSPKAWLKVMNELQGDPVLHDRYQIWLFMYPTGTPFPYSAAKLRASLDEFRASIDPRHVDPALDQTVLIGHSMGGLISKMMIAESGEALWKLASPRPFEELRATPERKALLRQVFFFHAHPSIRRVLYIATPHRGSELSDQFIGRLADRLIRMPGPLRSTYRALLAQNGADFFTPAIRSGLPSSIDELRQDNKLLLTLAALPVRPGVVRHSVIGRNDPAAPLLTSTDGVVPYVSSHIDGVASEVVVKGDHSCQDTPETIQEIRRILTAHLDQVAREAAAPRDPNVWRIAPRASDGAAH